MYYFSRIEHTQTEYKSTLQLIWLTFQQNNKIQEISQGSFVDMTELVLCQLNNNKLQRLTNAVVMELGMNAR